MLLTRLLKRCSIVDFDKSQIILEEGIDKYVSDSYDCVIITDNANGKRSIFSRQLRSQMALLLYF